MSIIDLAISESTNSTEVPHDNLLDKSDDSDSETYFALLQKNLGEVMDGDDAVLGHMKQNSVPD
eukprot:9234242-Karenia_brevis.AAC.1